MARYASSFPTDFVWGVATAAPQIEGAAFADGKGESIWDRYSRIPGKVHNSDTLDEACDHYNRFEEDFRLMRRLGIRNYRLSLAWPRIFPNGDGKTNQAGIDFYHRLFDSMAENGITPWVTFFHWDLPQSLEDRGGWGTRVVVDAFANYADTVVRAFGDKVKNWITLNEIRCFTILGYGAGGNKAPGRVESQAFINQTYHNALVCHGHAVRAVRQFGGTGARVGLTDNCTISVPVTETERDIDAARSWFAQQNIHLLDPIYKGRYDPAYLDSCGMDAPDIQDGDFELISLPTDYLGLNIYTATYVRAGDNAKPEALNLPENYPRADSPWLFMVPQAIYWGPRFAREVYGVDEIYITENGCGYTNELVVNGEVNDLHRRDFLRNHLREVHRAIGDDIPVKGYFLWSFMDNFEWEDGYSRRFGIVHIDYKTQQRTPKLSANWYSQVLRENRIV